MVTLLVVLGVLAAGAVAYFLLRKPKPAPPPPAPPPPPPTEPPPPAPPPPEPPPAAPAALVAGYYYANSVQYGRHFDEVKNFVNLYMDWEPDTQASRQVPPGKKLYIALNIGWNNRTADFAIKEAIRHLQPVWDRIVALELADEPQWNTSEMIANAAVVRKAVSLAGLPHKPIGATFTGKQILNGFVWKAAGLDWIGVEAYIEYRKGEKPVQARKRVSEHIKAQLNRIGGRKVVLVCQAYDRNGTWLDIGSLVAIQEPTFQAARALGSRLVALTMFSYARPGGTKDHPELLAEHKRLLKVA